MTMTPQPLGRWPRILELPLSFATSTISLITFLFEPLGLFNIVDNLDLVSEDNPEKLEARYGNLLPVIVKAIQEESAEKDKEIKALKERLNALEKRLNQILYKRNK